MRQPAPRRRPCRREVRHEPPPRAAPRDCRTGEPRHGWRSGCAGAPTARRPAEKLARGAAVLRAFYGYFRQSGLGGTKRLSRRRIDGSGGDPPQLFLAAHLGRGGGRGVGGVRLVAGLPKTLHGEPTRPGRCRGHYWHCRRPGMGNGAGAAAQGQRASARVDPLESGLAQIDFISGTSVWLEGPAAFRLVSARSGYLESGKLVARLPRGTINGFQVDCPLGTILDKGTAFGVEIKAGKAAVHVLAGMVEVTPKDGVPVSYVAGQAVAIDQLGAVRPTFFDPRLFDESGYGWAFGSFGILGAGPGPNLGPGSPWNPIWGPPSWKGWDSARGRSRSVGCQRPTVGSTATDSLNLLRGPMGVGQPWLRRSGEPVCAVPRGNFGGARKIRTPRKTS